MAVDLLGAMRVEIIGDNSKLDKSIDTSKKKTEDYEKKISTIGKTLKSVFTGVAILAVVKGIARVSKEMITAASNAQETRNKFNVVFESVADDARDSADRIKDEFKLSDETVENFLSGVGDITSGLGATSKEALTAAEQITKLGLDINSFANLSGGAEQAVSALTSLFTGEREAAKSLGIVINDTNLKAYAEEMGLIFKELTPLEKGFLSLELATKQSELAIGDFARSSDSYANTVKAAEEATKDLKAAIGESLLPAATQSFKIFSSLTTKLTEYVKEHNELRTLLDKFEDDNDTAADRVALTELEIAATQKLYDENLKILTLRQGTAQNLQDEQAIELLFEKASLLNTELRAKQRLLDTLREEAAAEKEVIDALKEKEAEVTRLATVQLELSATLEARRRAALTDDEIAIDNLNKQIERWAQFRDVVGVQSLLNDLIAERNELLKEETEQVEFVNIAYQESLIDRTFAHRAFTEAVLENDQEMQKSAEDYAAIGLGALTAGFENIGVALVEGTLGIEDFGKLFLNSISSVLTALGSELAALATVQLLLGNAPGAAIGYFESGAAFIASGVVKGLASFNQGGIVAGAQFGKDTVPAMLSPNETVMNPRQQAEILMAIANGGMNTGGTGGKVIQNIVNLDGKAIINYMAKASDDGRFITNARSVKG